MDKHTHQWGELDPRNLERRCTTPGCSARIDSHGIIIESPTETATGQQPKWAQEARQRQAIREEATIRHERRATATAIYCKLMEITPDSHPHAVACNAIGQADHLLQQLKDTAAWGVLNTPPADAEPVGYAIKIGNNEYDDKLHKSKQDAINVMAGYPVALYDHPAPAADPADPKTRPQSYRLHDNNTQQQMEKNMYHQAMQAVRETIAGTRTKPLHLAMYDTQGKLFGVTIAPPTDPNAPTTP